MTNSKRNDIVPVEGYIKGAFGMENNTEKRKKVLVKAAKRIVDVMFLCGIFVELFVPLLMMYAGKYYSTEIRENYWGMTITFLLAGICGLSIVYDLRRMMRTVMEENCFVQKNVSSLRRMGKMALIIAVLFLIKMSFMATPATIVIVVTFLIAGMFSFVLAFVFDEAIRYKEENDLTI